MNCPRPPYPIKAVTVTALIGYGGLGQFILLGLNRTFNTAIILGGVLSVLFAVVADFLLLRAERLLTPWSRTSHQKAVA